MSLQRIAVATALVLILAASLSAGGPPQTNKVSPELQAKLFGMRGVPAVPAGMDAKTLFPMIDPFGQYRHKDWPGKTHSAEDLARHKANEAADLLKHSAAADWDQYGGWKTGVQLKATGRFRVEKYRAEKGTEKWWLVDPEGRLFWSHGIDCVSTHEGTTPITDRKHWFSQLPAKDSPLAHFYGQGTWAPHGYYQGKQPYETFNFTAANLSRKYGSKWKTEFAEICGIRLRSWGLNTMGNWSDSSIYLRRKTPYVVTVGYQSRGLEGSDGYWRKFADVFDAGFAPAVRKGVAAFQATSANDPWCLGYFVDNELSWGDELSLALAALASPADQPAKRTFVEDLKKKYVTIEQLNKAWGTSHASWDALIENRKTPDKRKAYDDMAAFATKTAEQYFRTCRDAVKESAPNVLYLGCRFAWTNDRAVLAAGKYCDVLSFNRYQKSVAGLPLPKGVDRPMLIGEFHFGALDRGMFHTGLVATADQTSRAAAYKHYVQSALEHPQIVGTHWFQFGDQATTGRGDGENYQIGFVDICDTPYAETIQASREIGQTMYRVRLP
jgi:hypothetical protein